MKVNVHKIASVTKNVHLKKIVEISKKIISKEGYILVVEVLDNKKIYNQLELTSGRLSTMRKGDLLVVALGERKALKGFAGEIPKKLKPGDIIHILNIGGVAGKCTSENREEVGRALAVKVIGAVVDDKKRALSIHQFRIFKPAQKIIASVPLIVVSGTCMNVGKTSVACEITKAASRHGYKIFTAKVAGIAALKDIKNMQDAGAQKTVSIIDGGITSTAIHPKEPLEVAKGAINFLSKDKPDYIVVELGDGILGEYGVMDILADQEFRKHIHYHIGCAHDPPGALKLYEICKKIKVPLSLLSGPVTDNSVGVNFIKKHLRLNAINALSEGEKIFPELLDL